MRPHPILFAVLSAALSLRRAASSAATPGRSWLALTVLMVGALSLRATPPANDTCANAQPLSLNIPVMGTTIGANNDYQLSGSACFTGLGQVPSIAAGPDVVYTFQAPSTDTYSIKVYNYASDPNELVIYAASACPSGGSAPMTVNNCIAAANRVIGGPEELYCLPLTSNQLIYIFVDEDYLTSGSTFSIEVNRCRKETEPNNSTATANSLPSGAEGSLSTTSDQDYYALGTFPAGSRLFAMVDGSAAKTTYFNMDLVTDSGTTVEVDAGDNDYDFGDQSANIAGAILPAQPVYLRIYNPLNKANEPYRIYAVVQPPYSSATLETEPNDNYLQADSAANNYFRGTLSSSTDMDVFSFTANAGDLIFLSLDCDPLRDLTPINGRLELLDASGTVLEAVDDDNANSFTNSAAPSSPGEALVYRAAVTGTYLARVSISTNASGPVASGDYLLSISKNGYIGAGIDTPPGITNLSITNVNEGAVALLTGTIIDPDTGEAFKVTIDWGDNSTSATNLTGTYNFSVAHVYRNNPPGGSPFGSYAITVTATDNGGASGTNTTSVIVSNVAPGLTLQALPTSIPENGTTTLNVTVLDPSGLDAHVVSVDWADGSPFSVTNLPAGQTNFSMTHQYLDDNPSGTIWDIFTITAVVTDSDSASGTNRVSLIVNNVPPVLSNVSITSPVLPNQAATLQGNISDVGTLDTFAVEVRWGDGTPTQTNFFGAGTLQFSLPHVYQVAGTNLTVQVTLRDDDLGVSSTNVPVVILSVAQPQLTLGWAGDALSLHLQGSDGISYQVQTTTNLTRWDAFTNLTINPGGSINFVLPNTPSEPGRFYRAIFP